MDYHVTSLTAYNLCAHAFKYGESKPKLSDTYKGDLLNSAVTNVNVDFVEGLGVQSDFSLMLKYYAKQLNGDISHVTKTKEVMQKAMKYIAELKRDIYNAAPDKPLWFFQETKLFMKLNDTDNLVGTPDLFYYDPRTDQWHVEDFKFSSVSRYGNKDILKYDCQVRAYPLMLMNAFDFLGIEKVHFRFHLYDKSNAKFSAQGDQIVTKQQAQDFVMDVFGRMKASEQSDMWFPQENPKCRFCELRNSCPLMQIKYQKKDDTFVQEGKDDFIW